jgi:hypothetical protein
MYGMESPRKFEIWGSIAPNPDGSWDETWIPLGKFDTMPPSGEIPRNEDDYAIMRVEGHNYDFLPTEFAPDPYVTVRYLRFKTLETFNGPSPAGSVCFKELDFWGKIMDE